MNVYDFDKTIYDGDSTLDFYKYCLKKQPFLILYLPIQLLAFFNYQLGFITKLQFKEKFYGFLKHLKRREDIVTGFWYLHKHKIKEWYINQKEENDVIISASPEFLLEPIIMQLSVKTLIASKVDFNTGKCLGENCYGQEKVRRFKDEFGDYEITQFYSDSLSDLPLAKISQESFIVYKNKIIKWEEYSSSKLELFLNKEFLLFLLVGIVNTFNGIFFSYIFSIFLNSSCSFILGYVVSLSISYCLNSVLTFKTSMSFIKFIKFCISYIPNFAIQLTLVLILLHLLGIHKLLVYTISSIIGVPITFLMIKFFALRK